ncbi:alpha/beta hydrolase [Lapillicoccus sp.]|uniref:alpha/beta fold hydrolase n=1 Tax=Lapillicoccus sp. TaxID=1909287 RepID=UPI0032645F68
MTIVRRNPAAGRRYAGQRLLLLLVMGALVLTVASCSSPASEQTTSAAGSGTTATGDSGRSIDIGNGRTLFMECRGVGRPTVILESGIHDSSEYWVNIQPNAPAIGPDVFAGIAQHTKTCRYDRPGTLIPGQEAKITERSTPVTNPRTIDQASADLDALIKAAGLEGPFLMVGHSFGGWLQTYYTQTHPRDVVGLVLVDAFSARMPEFMGDKWTAYEKVLNSLGGNPLGSDPASEKYDVLASAKLSLAAPGLPKDLPMAVMSKSEPFPLPADLKGFTSADLETAWTKVQDALVELVPNTPHVIAQGSDHDIRVRDPDLVTSTVVLILERVPAR